MLSRSGAPLAAVVIFHGVLASPRPADAANIKAKVLVCDGAADPLVPSPRSFFDDVRVAVGARRAAGMAYGECRRRVHCGRPVVPVGAEILGDEPRPHDEERHEPGEDQPGQSKQVLRVAPVRHGGRLRDQGISVRSGDPEPGERKRTDSVRKATGKAGRRAPRDAAGWVPTIIE